MDYKIFRNLLSPYLIDHTAGLQEFKKLIASISTTDAFDRKFLAILNNMLDCFETNEAIKKVAISLLDESDFFSDVNIHKANKSKFLDKILSDSDLFEKNKSFSISVIQSYVEKIVHKQLYEINIKIEENQRSLNKIEAATGRTREEIQNFQPNLTNQTNLSSGDNIAETFIDSSSSVHPPHLNTVNLSSDFQPNSSSTAAHSKSQLINMLPETFLLVEIEEYQSAIFYDSIVEILKFEKPISEKVLKLNLIPYSKLVGLGSVLKKLDDIHMDKKQYVNNINATLPCRSAKRFAVLLSKESSYSIIFVDYIVYTEPIDGKLSGEFVETAEGKCKLISI